MQENLNKESCSLFNSLKNHILFENFHVREDFHLVDSNLGQFKVFNLIRNRYCFIGLSPKAAAQVSLSPPTPWPTLAQQPTGPHP
jgi:hypothetical protein